MLPTNEQIKAIDLFFTQNESANKVDHLICIIDFIWSFEKSQKETYTIRFNPNGTLNI